MHQQIDIAGLIYNHCIALHRRYYRLTGKCLNKFVLMKQQIVTLLDEVPDMATVAIIGDFADTCDGKVIPLFGLSGDAIPIRTEIEGTADET